MITCAGVVIAEQFAMQALDPFPPECILEGLDDIGLTLRREADELASQEQSVLGDLRKLEIERQIRDVPEQWVWMHDRWRDRPKWDVAARALNP